MRGVGEQVLWLWGSTGHSRAARPHCRLPVSWASLGRAAPSSRAQSARRDECTPADGPGVSQITSLARGPSGSKPRRAAASGRCCASHWSSREEPLRSLGLASAVLGCPWHHSHCPEAWEKPELQAALVRVLSGGAVVPEAELLHTPRGPQL